MIRELPDNSTRERDINAQLRDLNARESLSGVTAQQAVTEQKIKDNAFLLQDGSHGGVRVSRPDTSVAGIPGTQITKPVTIEDSARFTGVHFKDQVSVTSSGITVMFVGCRFDTSNTPVVSVQSGTKAHFVGCLFTNTPTGDVINNPGGGATTINVHVVGCSNATGQSMGNVTETAVTT